MANDKINRFVLDDLLEDHSLLLAIYSSSEIYRIAYHINRVLNINLKRQDKDIDLQVGGIVVDYPFYHFFDKIENTDYYFIANKGIAKTKPEEELNLLFKEANIYHTYLIPERKNVDYFLKIENPDSSLDFREYIKQIHEIKTVHEMDIAGIKSYNNLIFD